MDRKGKTNHYVLKKAGVSSSELLNVLSTSKIISL